MGPELSARDLNSSIALREDESTNVAQDPAPHRWELAKNEDEIEAYRRLYDLIRVDSTPREAAMMPSWPQALLQYFLINPPFDFTFSSHSTQTFSTSTYSGHETSITYGNGMTFDNYNDFGNWVHDSVSNTKGFALGTWQVIQMIFLPFTFVAWTVSFGLIQKSKAGAGWLSVMGWVGWFDPISISLGAGTAGGLFGVVPLLFQWAGSFAVVIQRWRSLGDIAYEITNLNGCIPVNGLDYLQQGARSRNFRILQTVNFSVATFFAGLYLPKLVKSPQALKSTLATIALAELIYEIVVARRGTPMVVSGNCLLVELNPKNGFLDSSINTRWKVFSSFMGF